MTTLSLTFSLTGAERGIEMNVCILLFRGFVFVLIYFPKRNLVVNAL